MTKEHRVPSSIGAYLFLEMRAEDGVIDLDGSRGAVDGGHLELGW